MQKKIGKLRTFFGEFKTFITRGNVFDMAVGVIVGGAFTAIVNGLGNYILKPIINWLIALVLGREGLSNVVTYLPKGKVYKDVLDASGAVIGKEIDMAASFYIDWGSFISAIINFFITAFVLFMLVRAMNKIAEANKRIAEGIDLDEQMELYEIRRERRVSKKEARRIYEARVEALRAEKAEETRRAEAEAAEAAAEEARRAEEKATANTRLLEEIRDILKSK